MRSARHWSRLVALLGLLSCLPLFGCRWAEIVTVQIPDFDSSAVEGVWIWREAAAGGAFERNLHFRLDDTTYLRDGEEYVLYTLIEPSGESRWTLPARLERDPADQDRVKIRFLLLLVEGGGHFRASTYNAAGESALSAQTLDITAV